MPDGDATLGRYDWWVRTTRWCMNAIAPLPLVLRIFALNHDFVMRRGLIGIRRHLGVAGREIDPGRVAPAV